ncbi:MAG: DUF1588 domain-containing protein [Novosphingobium sp.]
MKTGSMKPGKAALGLALAAAGLSAGAWTAADAGSPPARPGPSAATLTSPPGQIVAMRRISEAQYRNAISDIFGPDITVAGRFEPVVRPVGELIASGSSDAAISPAGLEQFDAMARVIAGQVFNDAHRAQFVDCAPANPAAADAACASKVLTPLGRYIFRRPLTSEEQAFYVKLAGDGAGPTQSFDKGLELALAAMLTSPNFLYIVETAEADPAAPGQLRLDNYSRATRLAMTLWNSAPNDALLDAAAAGDLTNQAKLEAVVNRMVQSPRMEAGVRAFFADMLKFEKFDELSKDPLIYPYFNQDVLKALPEQMLRTISDHLLTRNGDYRELFTTRRTFMTRALGGLYQVRVPKSQGWVPYEFSPSDDRAGLLGQAGFLALYSHSGRSSPTLRGRAIRELMMCQPVPNPPGNVNFTAVQDTENKAMPTARIRLTAHNTDPVCAACHRITDPPGFALEKFDGIGKYRAAENDAQIDVSGALGSAKFSGALGLGQAMNGSGATTQCVASRAMEYATGRPSANETLVQTTEKAFAAKGYGIRALFFNVMSRPETWQVPKGGPVSGATHVSLNR